MIIDTQIHLYGPNRPDRPWINGGAPSTHLQRSVDAAEVLGVLNENGVDRAIIIPPPWDRDGVEMAYAAAEAHPNTFGVVAQIDLTSAHVRERVEHWLDRPGTVGIRVLCTTPDTVAWLDGGSVDWFWSAAERTGLPVMLYPPTAMQRVHRIAALHPDLVLMIDHLGLGQRKRDAEAFAYFEDLLSLARHPNIYAKLSALPTYVSDGYPFKSLAEPIRKVYDAFGPRRMMWGSDYTKLPCTYREWLDVFRVNLDFLSPEDKAWILGKSAATALQWPNKRPAQ